MKVFSGLWVVKAESGGMQQHFFPFPTATVEAVTDNCRAKTQGMGGVHPQLMSPTGYRPPGDSAAIPLNGNSLPEAERGFAVNRIVDLSRSVPRVESMGQVDCSARGGDNTVHHSQVAFVNSALGKLLVKLFLGLGGDGKNHQPRGSHV